MFQNLVGEIENANVKTVDEKLSFNEDSSQELKEKFEEASEEEFKQVQKCIEERLIEYSEEDEKVVAFITEPVGDEEEKENETFVKYFPEVLIKLV